MHYSDLRLRIVIFFAFNLHKLLLHWTSNHAPLGMQRDLRIEAPHLHILPGVDNDIDASLLLAGG